MNGDPCAVDTQIGADLSAMYAHLFGIKGVSAGPVLEQKNLALVYDLSASGKLAATLVETLDLNAVSIDGAAQEIVFQNNTQGCFTLVAIRIDLTAGANHTISIRMNGLDVFYYNTVNANSIITIMPGVVTESIKAGGGATENLIGPGNMWIPPGPSGNWSYRINAGAPAEVVTATSFTYSTPFGIEPP